jgi:choloylglycine hydrolase
MCLSFRLTAKDGSVIVGRSQEFNADMRSNIIVVPRGQQFTGTAPNGGQGLTWDTKYAWMAANGLGMTLAADGQNEAGLGFGALYFPHFAEYEQVPAGQERRALANWEIGGWALSSFATVAEVRSGLSSVLVGDVVLPQVGGSMPCHYIFYDRQGDCAVVEYVKGQRNVYDNPLGLMTNSPGFDWHVTNLTNYVNLSVTNVPPVDLAGLEIGPLSQGSGLRGLPGDWTAPSRFIRAVVMTQAVDTPGNAAQGVNLALHILNAFDISRGLVRPARSDTDGADDITYWATVKDLTNQIVYFRTYDNLALRMVDMKQVDTSTGGIKTVQMAGPADWVLDLTREAR